MDEHHSATDRLPFRESVVGEIFLNQRAYSLK